MKQTLYLKFLLGYLVFGILGFILVSTVTNYGLRNQIESVEDAIYIQNVPKLRPNMRKTITMEDGTD